MKKLKRILAWIAVVILLGFYLTTFIMAFFVTPKAVQMFKTSIIATIMIPILLYVILFLYRLIHSEEDEKKEEKEQKG